MFKLPLFRNTVYFADRNSAVSSFVVVLPALPVIATTFAPDRRRTSRAPSCSARVVSATSITSGAGPAFPASGKAGVAVTTAPAAPAASAAATKSCPSNRSPRMATNRSPGCTDRVSIDHRSTRWSPARRETTRPPVAAAISAARQRNRLATGPRHPRAAAPARQRGARDLDVVERQRPVADDLVLLVPLAGDEHRSPRLASVIARSIASRRSTIASDGVPRVCPFGAIRSAGMTIPRWISSMIRSGSSLRGLSEVTIDQVAEARGDGAHQRALRAIAIAAAAEHGDDAAGRERPRGLEQVLQRVVGMRVVDDDADVVGGVGHDLEPAGHVLQAA